ncbi:MAG TPA: cation:proton antiporter [bacterium]|nr:cation:proton antiporter [bacterium]HQQ38184.1 cation:proton antiporter [bacterium]
MESNLFLQLSTILAITVSVAFFVRLAKQPLLVAYIIAGIIGGPLLLNILPAEEPMYHAFANFGVVLLLFIIGLDLNFSYLKKIGKEAVIIGGLQFLLNFGMLLPLARSFGLSWQGAIFLALASCFSSTIVVLKILNDKQDEEVVYGRYTIGLMLVQDLISIIILLYLSFSSSDVLVGSSFWFIIKALAVIAGIILMAKYVLPEFLNKISSSGEFLFIFTIAWCFGVASLLLWSGFSLEVGAVIAGLSLGSSRFHTEIASRIKPLRDFFIVIFFIILGSGADFSNLSAVLVPALFLSAFVLVFKPLILYILFRFRRFTRRNSFLAALTSGQLSEFGFIILFTAASLGYLNGSEVAIFTAAAIITIFFSSYAMIFSYKIYNLFLPLFLFFGPDVRIQEETKKEKFEVIIFGYHRTGWKIGQALKKKKISFAAVDFNPERAANFQHQGVRSFFGDASDIEFLQSLPLDSAKTIISTIPSPEDQLVLINFVRRHNPKAIIIASLYQKKYLPSLYAAGADYVILPHLLGGAWAAEVISAGALSRRSVWRQYRRQQARDLNGS